MKNIHWADRLSIASFVLTACFAAAFAYKTYKDATCKTLYIPVSVQTPLGRLLYLKPLVLCGRPGTETGSLGAL